ncbi:hypothetical protein [Bradyrhizobium sp. LA2.1]|uniref:hypothetical protein n=1 Tax=Bradyrhizobium sp. LA2.1 TaxID=3156376 RepID=UPI00339543BC
MSSTVLRIKRTLDGAEIDKIKDDVEPRKAGGDRASWVWTASAPTPLATGAAM